MSIQMVEKYWYARGYHDGRLLGYPKSQVEIDESSDELRLAYKQGYDCGVPDFCELDLEDDFYVEHGEELLDRERD